MSKRSRQAKEREQRQREREARKARRLGIPPQRRRRHQKDAGLSTAEIVAGLEAAARRGKPIVAEGVTLSPDQPQPTGAPRVKGKNGHEDIPPVRFGKKFSSGDQTPVPPMHRDWKKLIAHFKATA